MFFAPAPETRNFMISNILTRIFGSRNERLLKEYGHQVRKINALEPTISALSDEALRAKTAEFKERIAGGATLDDVLPEAFAVVREAGKRALSMRHFDVQLLGGIALHNGKIAEMRTGEGKTLVATLPIYLNALAGKGVHLVTINDYLAQRDADWMGRIYTFLGLTVGVNLSQMEHDAKQVAYAADITYGTNNEFGFDYLRDNMVYEASQRVQRGLSYAIVDEVDSILIDEARTPLIISGQADDNVDLYYRLNELAPKLTRQEDEKGPGDYFVDEKGRQVLLSEEGHEHAEQILTAAGLLAPNSSLYDAHNIALVHHMYAALRAHALFQRDQHYVVQDGEIVIVDEFTGRLMSGRRWSEGLHQAVEAKEGVPIQRENQTLASITFQNYFRMYFEARRHDGHRRHRGVRVPADLPPRDDGHSHAHADGAQGRERPGVPDVRREGQGDRHRRQGMPRARPAGAGRHDLDRELRAPVEALRQGEAAASGAERQAARARGRDRRAGGAAEDGHHRDQYGGPRHGHRAGRQPRAHDPEDSRRSGPVAGREGARDRQAARRMAIPPRCRRRRGRAAHRRHRAARITPDRQPAARPRGTSGRPGVVALLHVARGSAAAHLRWRAARR